MNILKGNRTYIMAAIAVGYAIGGKAGLWPVDAEIMAMVFASGLAFLRAGVKATEDLVSEYSGGPTR